MAIVALAVGFIGGVMFSSWSMRTMMPPVAEMPTMPPTAGGTLPSPAPGTEVGPAKINREEAIKKMEEMLKQDPNNSMALIHLGNFYHDSNQPQKAVAYYERAIKVDPNNPDVITDCGIMYRDLGQFDKAIEYFNRSTKLNPNHFQSWFNLGVVYRNDKKNYPKAIEAWQKALSINPNMPGADEIRSEITQMQEMMKAKKKVGSKQ